MFACLYSTCAPQPALVALASSFSPLVEDTSPGVVVFSIVGLSRLIGTIDQIASAIARTGAEARIQANLAIASDPDAAVIAARHKGGGINVIPPGREAGHLSGLPIHVLGDFIADDGLRILDTLDRWGIRTLGELAALPELGFIARFGDLGERLLRLARGETRRALRVREAPETYERRADLEHPLVLLEPLLFLLSSMLVELTEALARQGLATNRVTLGLRLAKKFTHATLRNPERQRGEDVSSAGDSSRSHPPANVRIPPLPDGRGSEEWSRLRNSERQRGEDVSSAGDSSRSHPPANVRIPPLPDGRGSEEWSRLRNPERQRGEDVCKRTLEFPVPVRDPQVILKQLQFDLEAHPPQAAVLGVEIHLHPAEPRPLQHGLFIPQAPAPEKLSLTLARLTALVGEGNAGSPELLDTHRPDAFRMRSFSPEKGDSLLCPQQPTAGSRPEYLRGQSGLSPFCKEAFRFAFRYSRPAPSAQVRLKADRPIAVNTREVLAAAGPWRASGDWWTASPWDREEWDVELSDGGLYRIFFLKRILDPPRSSREWFLEGVYD